MNSCGVSQHIAYRGCIRFFVCRSCSTICFRTTSNSLVNRGNAVFILNDCVWSYAINCNQRTCRGGNEVVTIIEGSPLYVGVVIGGCGKGRARLYTIRFCPKAEQFIV